MWLTPGTNVLQNHCKGALAESYHSKTLTHKHLHCFNEKRWAKCASGHCIILLYLQWHFCPSSSSPFQSQGHCFQSVIWNALVRTKSAAFITARKYLKRKKMKKCWLFIKAYREFSSSAIIIIITSSYCVTLLNWTLIINSDIFCSSEMYRSWRLSTPRRPKCMTWQRKVEMT